MQLKINTLVLAMTTALLTGCSIIPLPLTQAEVQKRVRADQQAIFAEQPPVKDSIGLGEALARAYRYNLENRLKLMENALAQGQLDLAQYDMLPRLTAAAGYTSRNNDAGGTAVNLNTGAIGTDPTTAQERRHHTEQLTLSWNVLDFGISYVRAQQLGNQVLIAQERRRKMLQNITQDVYTAYYRALAAQRSAATVETLLHRTEAALADARATEEQRLLSPLQSLLYQRGLIEIVQQLQARRIELQNAHTELAALMNLQPGANYTLAERPLPAMQPIADVEQQRLALLALTNRPELRVEDHLSRNSELEAKRLLLSVLPAVQFDSGYRADSNKYLYNNNWWENGVSISMNLFRVFALPAAKRQQDAQHEVDEARRRALTMAVLAQVRLASERYRQGIDDYRLSEQMDDIDNRIREQITNAVHSRSETELEQIRAEARALLSRIQRDYSQASLQAAHARLMNSLGIDLLEAEMPWDLDTLTQTLERRYPSWTVPAASSTP